MEVKGEYQFASRFVKKYVLDCLIAKSDTKPLRELPISSDRKFDFINILQHIIRNMDRNTIIIETDTKQNDFDSKVSKPRAQQCDTVISLHGFTILVEHCADVALSEKREDTNTLKHHIGQAINYSTSVSDIYHENYSKDEQNVQTCRLNWTSIPAINFQTVLVLK